MYTHQESLSENLVAFATNKSSCKRGAYTVYHATLVKKQTIWALSFAMKHHNIIWALLIKRDYWSCLHFFNFKKMVIIGFKKKKKGRQRNIYLILFWSIKSAVVKILWYWDNMHKIIVPGPPNTKCELKFLEQSSIDLAAPLCETRTHLWSQLCARLSS